MKDELKKLLVSVQNGSLNIEEALKKIKLMPFFEDLGYAKIDHHRSLRWGWPEVIYCPGKLPEEVANIAKILAARNNNVLATRATKKDYEAVVSLIPEAIYHKRARMITIQKTKIQKHGKILVCSAGTADLPVAEEAAICAEMMGRVITRLYDVGVSGLHRILNHRHLLEDNSVYIVVAGMEGALASVVAGLVDRPVIAVPTSTGYGASFNGLSALLGMLNSCAAGVGVVNIDNGFGAAALADSILNVGEEE